MDYVKEYIRMVESSGDTAIPFSMFQKIGWSRYDFLQYLNLCEEVRAAVILADKYRVSYVRRKELINAQGEKISPEAMEKIYARKEGYIISKPYDKFRMWLGNKLESEKLKNIPKDKIYLSYPCHPMKKILYTTMEFGYEYLDEKIADTIADYSDALKCMYKSSEEYRRILELQVSLILGGWEMEIPAPKFVGYSLNEAEKQLEICINELQMRADILVNTLGQFDEYLDFPRWTQLADDFFTKAFDLYEDITELESIIDEQQFELNQSSEDLKASSVDESPIFTRMKIFYMFIKVGLDAMEKNTMLNA